MDCKLKMGGCIIEGQTFPSMAEALTYLKTQGFSPREALDYLKDLPAEEVTNE